MTLEGYDNQVLQSIVDSYGYRERFTLVKTACICARWRLAVAKVPSPTKWRHLKGEWVK